MDATPLPPPSRVSSRGWLRLGPMGRRRLDNFRRNRRGYWSTWIFCVLFVLSLFAEFIANDRPIIAMYKGELLFPILVNYPEEKFGGFLAETDYRDPTISDEIAAHGWMIWPLVRFANNTRNLDVPTPAPSPPTWLLSEAQCRTALRRRSKRGNQSGRSKAQARAGTWNGIGLVLTIRRAMCSRA